MTDTIVQSVVAKHADEIPILLHMRDRFLQPSTTYPNDLRTLDKRIAANLEGLALAGEGGWKAAVALFEGRPEPATVVAVANLAYARKNESRIAYLRDALKDDHALIEMAAFGLSWLGPKRVKVIVQSLWLSGDDIDIAMALACSLIYDFSSDLPDIEFCFARNKLVRLWAIRLAGWYDVQVVLPLIIAANKETDPMTSMACDTALVLLEHNQMAIHRILNRLEGNVYASQETIEIALHGLDPNERMRWWEKQGDPDLRLRTSYIISDRRCVPWLLEQCEEGAYADEAMGCIHQITSSNVESMMSEPMPDKIADPFAVASVPPQNAVPKLSHWWGHEKEKIPDGPVCLTRPFDQTSLEDDVQILPLSVQQTVAYHNRLERKMVNLPIGRSPYLQNFIS